MKKIKILGVFGGLVVLVGLAGWVRADFTDSFIDGSYLDEKIGEVNVDYGNTNFDFSLRGITYRIDYNTRAIAEDTGIILNPGDEVRVSSTVKFSFDASNF